MNKITLIFLILTVSLLLVACEKAQDQPSIFVNAPEVTNSEPVAEQNTQQTNTQAQIKEFTVRGSSFKFTPFEIRVKKGDRVRINYISDDIGHNFVIDELNVKTNIISKGQTEIVEFVADKEGTFSVYCSVGSHRSLGMEGKLIVEP